MSKLMQNSAVNTFFYKLSCLSPEVPDLYVGHTTNFVRRKHMHKHNSLNINSSKYTGKLYEFIRSNGGWANWSMELVELLKCKDRNAAKQKQQDYIHELRATLNTLDVPTQAHVAEFVPAIIVPETTLEDEAPKPIKKPMDIDLYALVMDVMKSNTELHKQNQDMQKQFMEMFQQMQTTNNNINTNTNINAHNKTFNMQVFLNEHCKDAMNLKDFVDSIDLNLEDLESVGKAGFVEGIANIINNKLRATEVHLRPIHCSDAKREVMYIKENNKWEKEGPKNENMRKFVQFIERKNIKLLGEYQEKYPESRDIESPLNDHYVHLSLTATCATEVHLDKVISKIAKEVLIEK